MERKGFLTKSWKRSLGVSVFFLTFLAAGCQWGSQVRSLAPRGNISDKAMAEAERPYHSDTRPEDCILCGKGEGTLMPLYRGQENIGIINLNTFDLAPVTINQYDDFGKRIEKPVEGSLTHITNTGEDGFCLSVTADINRGYAQGSLSFSQDETLDMEKAASHLCADCLNRMMDKCWADVPMSMGVINFRTGDIRLFEEKILAFTLGDYYISCDDQSGEDGEEKDLSLFVFYCPERY